MILSAIAGIVKYDTPQTDTLVVTFDDEKTTTEKIVQAIRQGGLPVSGEPIELKN